jgi:hypothetical protein
MSNYREYLRSLMGRKCDYMPHGSDVSLGFGYSAISNAAKISVVGDDYVSIEL